LAIDWSSMGFSNVTGARRPKRPGCETKSERAKRRKRDNEAQSVSELRVVKQRGGARSEREPEQLAKTRSRWEKKLVALLKANAAIKALRARRDGGEPLDAQQEAKIARGDGVLLEIDALVAENPRAAEAVMAAREARAAGDSARSARAARESAAATAAEVRGRR